MHISSQHWGRHNQHEVFLFTLNNGRMKVSVTNYGATIVSIFYPDNNGLSKNRILGYTRLEDYTTDKLYMGCTVGRFANRIANAAYTYGGRQVLLSANEIENNTHLHGGTSGFNKKIFLLEKTGCSQEACSVSMTYGSDNGEEGYPGNVVLTVTFTLNATDELTIAYEATTDAPTPVSITNHSYFNLSGNVAPATGHQLFIDADFALENDRQHIPTGVIKPVAGTDIDFRTWRGIQDGVTARNKNGYNDYFIFNQPASKGYCQSVLRHAATGIQLQVDTSYAGMMLYTGDYLTPPFIPQQGICLETHLYPDSPNHAHFPTPFLLPGEVYRHFTTYRLSLYDPS